MYTGTNYTLDEWAKKTGVRYTNPYGDNICIHSDDLLHISALSSWQLYHLTDYVVSTACAAGVCWLMPRTNIEVKA